VEERREIIFICAAPQLQVSHFDGVKHQRLQRSASPDRAQPRGPHTAAVGKALQLQPLEAGRQPPFAGLVHKAEKLEAGEARKAVQPVEQRRIAHVTA
jgi:hypothetical protein